MSATENKKERSYAKKRHKTEPVGIRFNINQIGIALSKSGKDTKQELVDWLVDRYVNGENPIIERQSEMAASQQTTHSPIPPMQPLDKVSQFCQEIFYADSKKEIETIVAKAIKELDWKRQVTIKDYAAQIMEKKGFIYND